MTIKHALVLLSALITCKAMHSQILHCPVSGPYLGLGAYSLHHIDIFSLTSNQASLSQLRTAAAGIYAERRFMQNELNGYFAVFGLPARSGHFAISGSYSGFSDYNQTQIGLAYARNLGDKLDIGVQFNYHGILIAGYGNASAISFEAGVIFHLTEKLHSGFHISNPLGGKFGKNQQEKLPSVYTTGVGYDASEKFFFSAEIMKEQDQPVNVNAGIQYEFIPQLLVKGGISSATSLLWFGLGLPLRNFRLDVTSSYHPQLGVSPGLSLIFNFKASSTSILE